MVLQDESEDELFKKHSELCNKLNLEPKIISDSWESYQSINKNFVLEGDKLQWLGLAVFVTCRNVENPSVDPLTGKGNCLNLTSLLRHSNLSFAKFFSNINKWAEMAKLSEEFRSKIKLLKDTFSVTCNTFKEYYPLFEKMFNVPDAQEFEQSKQHRPRKQRPVLCNNSKVFEFVWMLFVVVKGENSPYSTDLVKAFHLLYACLDLAFKNAFLDDRRDLINPKFEALPDDWTNPAYEVPAEAPCTISYSCKCKSKLTEALHVKLYNFKAMITNLINSNVLNADKETLTGLFDEGAFETNFKNIVKMYETRLQQKGDLDERIYVTEYKRILLEREQAQFNVQAPHFVEPADGSLDSPRNATPGTPLTARQYLGARDIDNSPYSADKTATELINRLHNMIQNRTPEPSPALLQLFKSCSNDPTEKIAGIISQMSEKILDVSQDFTTKPSDAQYRVQIAVTLFYKFIESILENEKNIHSDVSNLVQKDLFFECMFGCCLEIVLFSYGSSKRFPWILEVLKIEAHQFVKVIELIIRSKENLYKHLIKHLNRIEETIIESLVWKSSSKFWEEIEKSGQNVPKFEDTALPGHLLHFKETATIKIDADQLPGPSATDRFQSPVSQSVNRQLFKTVSSGQTVVQKTTASGTPKRTGSLSIIFRKFYNLAGVRMEHLCTKLEITDIELKRKIWTVFEDSIRYTDLIKDRHLDQLLMSAVYVICKICNKQLTFENIMKYYREQPQASSNIYRSVLLSRRGVEERNGQTFEVPDKHGDLILFYNNVYVTIMKIHVLKYQTKQAKSDNDNFLSPLPAGKYHLTSPSVQIVDNVFIKPFDTANTTATGTGYNYIFSRSPSKDLKNINKAINNVIGKRLQTDADLDMPNSKRIANRKIQTLVEERRSQS